MLAVLNTEQLENILISGDYWDLKELQKAIEQLLHTSIENNCTNHVQKNYVLRFCRELEQAIEGEVAIETTYNGIYDELQEEFVIPFPQENIYFSFEKCWPKMLFTVLCLNHFIEETTTPKEQPFTQTILWSFENSSPSCSNVSPQKSRSLISLKSLHYFLAPLTTFVNSLHNMSISSQLNIWLYPKKLK